MTGEEILRQRQTERNQLLDRIVAALRADERVAAAWLAGSVGRGTADAWSDLDVWVAVEDEHVGAVSAGRREFVATVGSPLLVLEAPQNAPADGAYLLVLYPGKTGAHQVDWYWQDRSSARIPPRCRILFDRVGVPPLPAPAPLTDEDRARALTEKAGEFWVAALLAGKSIARRQPWRALRMLDWAGNGLTEVRWLIERDRWPSHDDVKEQSEAWAWSFPGERPEDQLALLRAVCQAMEALAPEMTSLGGSAPAEAVRQVYLFLDHIESMLDRPGRKEPVG